MNEPAVLLVRTARALVERWRSDAFDGDLDLINESVQLLAVALHQLGDSPFQVSEAYAPDRNVVGLNETITTIGIAIVGALENIRIELRLKRSGGFDEGMRNRQRKFERAISQLVNDPVQAALDD